MISDREVSDWLEFALAATGKVALPQQHARPDYDGTMMRVLMFRAAAVGNRLREMTVHNRCTYGYFVWISMSRWKSDACGLKPLSTFALR